MGELWAIGWNEYELGRMLSKQKMLDMVLLHLDPLGKVWLDGIKKENKVLLSDPTTPIHPWSATITGISVDLSSGPGLEKETLLTITNHTEIGC